MKVIFEHNIYDSKDMIPLKNTLTPLTLPIPCFLGLIALTFVGNSMLCEEFFLEAFLGAAFSLIISLLSFYWAILLIFEKKVYFNEDFIMYARNVCEYRKLEDIKVSKDFFDDIDEEEIDKSYVSFSFYTEEGKKINISINGATTINYGKFKEILIREVRNKIVLINK